MESAIMNGSMMLKPYYETPLGRLYHGDCLEIMPQLEPVDLVLTDPNYGENLPQKSKNYGDRPELSRKATSDKWDMKPFTKEQVLAFTIKSKNQIVFGANYCWEAFYSTRCYIVWDKRGNLPQVPFADVEFAWTSFADRMCKKYTVIKHGFIADEKGKMLHPTQKPTRLFIHILEDFSKENQIILDPFLGSGTTAIACERLKRKWIGIEIEEKYCEIAAKRIEAERKQLKLF